MMCVNENRCRCTTASDLFKDFAVRHLRKFMAANFFRRSCAKNADSTKPINDTARDIGLPIDLGWIEIFVEKIAQLGKGAIDLGLFRGGDARIRHPPVRHEMSLKKSLNKAQRLRSAEKQLLSLLNLLLPFDIDLAHGKSSPPSGGEAKHCSQTIASVQRPFLRWDQLTSFARNAHVQAA